MDGPRLLADPLGFAVQLKAGKKKGKELQLDTPFRYFSLFRAPKQHFRTITHTRIISQHLQPFPALLLQSTSEKPDETAPQQSP